MADMEDDNIKTLGNETLKSTRSATRGEESVKSIAVTSDVSK
jgi:hypothetical protein